MFGWRGKRRERKSVLPESTVDIIYPGAISASAPPPPPRPRYRIVQGPHSFSFWVQENCSWGTRYAHDVWTAIHGGFETEGEAEQWLDEHRAGPKVIKEYP